MNTRFSLAVVIATASVAMALTSAGCASAPVRAERYVAPAIGSSWVSVRRDTGSYGSSTAEIRSRRSEAMWQGKPVIAFEGPEVTVLAHPHGDWIGQFKGDTPVMTWDPPLGWEWPLEVGKTWTKRYTVTLHARKQTIPYQATQKVEAYESVTVPAGTFKAFKLTTVDTLGNENVTWFSPELGVFVKQSLRRTEKHAAGIGTRDVELLSQSITK